MTECCYHGYHRDSLEEGLSFYLNICFLLVTIGLACVNYGWCELWLFLGLGLLRFAASHLSSLLHAGKERRVLCLIDRDLFILLRGRDDSGV